VLWSWIQHFKWIRIQGFDDQKLKKKYSWIFLYIFFGSKIAIYLSLGDLKWRPSYRRSLQPSKKEHPALQKSEIDWLSSIFVGHFCPPGSGSNLDPDPQHCWPQMAVLIPDPSSSKCVHADPLPTLSLPGRGAAWWTDPEAEPCPPASPQPRWVRNPPGRLRWTSAGQSPPPWCGRHDRASSCCRCAQRQTTRLRGTCRQCCGHRVSDTDFSSPESGSRNFYEINGKKTTYTLLFSKYI